MIHWGNLPTRPNHGWALAIAIGSQEGLITSCSCVMANKLGILHIHAIRIPFPQGFEGRSSDSMYWFSSCLHISNRVCFNLPGGIWYCTVTSEAVSNNAAILHDVRLYNVGEISRCRMVDYSSWDLHIYEYNYNQGNPADHLVHQVNFALGSIDDIIPLRC